MNKEVALTLMTASKLENNKYKKIRHPLKLKADVLQQRHEHRHEHRHVTEVTLYREGSEDCGES